MADEPTVIVVTDDDPPPEPVIDNVIDHEGRIATVETTLGQISEAQAVQGERLTTITETIDTLDDRITSAVSLALEAIVVATEPEPTPEPEPEPDPLREPEPEPEPKPEPEPSPKSKTHRWWR